VPHFSSSVTADSVPSGNPLNQWRRAPGKKKQQKYGSSSAIAAVVHEFNVDQFGLSLGGSRAAWSGSVHGIGCLIFLLAD
jgi:hypothetical protein